MTDEQPPNEPAALTPEQIQYIQNFEIGGPEYVLKNGVEIPNDVVTHWTALQPTDNVVISLTRHDLDRLYFSITQLNAAVNMLSASVRQVSVSDFAGANVAFLKSSELLVSSDGNFRAFFREIMAKARKA